MKSKKHVNRNCSPGLPCAECYEHSFSLLLQLQLLRPSGSASNSRIAGLQVGLGGMRVAFTISNLNFTSSIFRFQIVNFSFQIADRNRKELNLQYAGPSGPIQASLPESVMSAPESDLAELPVLQYVDARKEGMMFGFRA